ncbi:thioredoxin domain-containing protein [Candidatus Kaiserbacteria bacterium]|nr:thioredoxin domain-containing protein [Candidatus Kaiserbacteria bacterium]
MKSSFTIPIAIIAGGLIVAGAVYVSSYRSKVTGGNPALVRPVSASDHIFGNPAARVMIVEYSDFDCIPCKEFEVILRQVVASEAASGSVALVFRHFPLTELHPNALALAKAAECAGEAGGNEAFWRFADALFANQPVSPSGLGALAMQARIPGSGADTDGNTFATCYASESASKPLVERIMRDRQNALDMGAQGAPYTVILRSGMAPIVMNGAYSYYAVKELVNRALGK